ncbi:MAG: xylulokinase [Clostridia bacterium]|nr:xylulokinase [Clostridia bacterium]
MNYYIGIDLGTSSVKLMLTAKDGSIANTKSYEYPVRYPNPGWSEQSPEDWWDAVVKGIPELIADIDVSCIKGIGVAGQMHGCVILDSSDSVIRPAILWNDGRTAKQTEYLNMVIGEDKISKYTANIAFAGFTAPKILWLRECEPDNFSKINKIMLPKDYINYRLTGVHACDYSDASGMLLLDVSNKCWSEEMLSLCGIDKKQMPQLFESFDCIGTVLPSVAKQLGLPDGVRVAAGAGDNAAAAIGTGTVGNGKCNISLGTSGTVFISSDSFTLPDSHAIHSFAHADGGFHLMGCILSAASCNKWFCEQILGTNDYASVEKTADLEKSAKNSLFFLPYLMGERSPINDTDATGMFIGLRPDTTRADMFTAVLEGVSFAIRDNMEIAKKLGIKIEESGICGGGSKSGLWKRMLSSVLNIRLCVPVSEEGPGYGGAILSMIAAGEYESVAECVGRFTSVSETVCPDEKLVPLYEEKYNKFKKVYPAVRQLYKDIKE